MPFDNAGAANPAPAQGGGNPIVNTLNKQLGPLKAWQWGVAIGGAFLLFKVISGRGSSGGDSTTTTVPSSTDENGNPLDFASLTDAVNALGNKVDQIEAPDNVIATVQKKLAYYRASVKHRAPIFDKSGKVIGHLAAGRKLLLGARVKIGGEYYYPILNMPGKYVKGGKNFDLTPVYTQIIESTSAVSNAVAPPATTIENSQQATYQGPNTAVASGGSLISPPAVDNAGNIQSRTAAIYQRLPVQPASA